jgi:hypothetical protein
LNAFNCANPDGQIAFGHWGRRLANWVYTLSTSMGIGPLSGHYPVLSMSCGT